MNKTERKRQLRSLLKKQFARIASTHIPRGIGQIADDLFLHTVTYNSYIAGLVTALLEDDKADIDPQNVKLPDHLRTLQNKSEKKLKELKSYNRRMERLAKTYLEYLSIRAKGG